MKRTKIIFAAALIALCTLLIILVKKEHKQIDPKYKELAIVRFDRDIFPIFRNSCAIVGCHDRQWGVNDYVFTNYESIIKGITPFDPDGSIVYRAILGKESSLMPPGRALTENEQILIRNWIGQGAEK